MNFKLTGKILIPTFLIVVVSMMITTMVSIRSASNALQSKVQGEMDYMVSAKADHIAKWLERNNADISNWSKDDIYKSAIGGDFVADGARKKANQHMRRILDDYPHISGLRLTNSIGKVIASSHPKNVGVLDVSTRSYFKEAIAGKINRSKIIVSKSTGNPIFTLAAPIEQNGHIAGVLYCVINIAKFQKSFIDSMKIGETGYAYMFNGAGMLFSHPDKSLIMKLDLSTLDFGKQMLATDRGVFEYTFKGIDKLAAVTKIDNSDWRVAITSPLSEIYGPATSLRNKLMAASLIVLAALCLGIWIMITKLVVKPVQKVSLGLKDIASGEGDLTDRLEVKGNDEIAQLASHFNTFVDQQYDIIKNISEKAQGLSASANQLSALSQQMSEGSDQTRHKARAVTEAATEMSANMNTVAAATEQAAGNVGMVATAVDEMSTTVAEIAKNAAEANVVTGDAVCKVDATSGNVKKLGDATQEINKVTEVITEISEQTNLLALNATIEAARAGEAGKGFAVVASEIKDLANQTASATQEIRSQIEHVQKSTSSTVDEIKEISGTINNVNKLVASIAAAVEEQAVTTDSITQNISQTDEGIQSVNHNIAGSNEVAGQIAEEIHSVDDAAADMSTNSSNLKENAAGLTTFAEELTGLVNRFKL